MSAKQKKRDIVLAIGAIGVVFGDIGTSPLYALQAVFGVSSLPMTTADIFGAISLIAWSVMLVVTVKYIGLVMRADNRGEGGIMALIALVWRTRLPKRRKALFTLIGLIGMSLFLGDSIITPAISVLSAVEGTKLIAPHLSHYILPATLLILASLFAIQSRGTAAIGALFGPIMIVWFIVSAIGGLFQIVHYPAVLVALSPSTAIDFFIAHPLQAFVSMGAVVLAITGTEALFADMGHFGRTAIKNSWLALVFPALILNYLGQGALVAMHPTSISSSYFELFPDQLQLPVIILAMVATLIASQAVISGAFSLTRQAVALGFLPRLTIRHTSQEEAGQIYIPSLNWLIALLVAIVVISFGSSTQLAGAYGMAVSGTLVVTSLLFLVVMHSSWKKTLLTTSVVGALLLCMDSIFLASSLSKLLHGAWLPLLFALIGFTIMSTWHKAHRIVAHERQILEGSLQEFVDKLHRRKITRIPGHAIYLGHNSGSAPLALHLTLENLHELHRYVVVVSVKTANIPHIPEKSRVLFDGLGHPNDNISHVTLQFGYKDTPNVPNALKHARDQSSELDFDPYKATYFLSMVEPVITGRRHLARWRKHLYVIMQRNASRPTDFFKLPPERTVEMSSFVDL